MCSLSLNYKPSPALPAATRRFGGLGYKTTKAGAIQAPAFVCYNGVLYYSRYCELMDLFSYTRRMVSAKRSAMLMMCTLSHCLV